MKTIPSVKQIVCGQPESAFCYFGWPSVNRLPDGTLAAVCSGFRLRHLCAFGKAVICYSYDEGKTWTAPAPVIDTLLDDRDAGITPFGGNRVFFASFNLSPAFCRKHNAQAGTPAQRKLINAHLDYIESIEAYEKQLGSTFRISEDGGYTFGSLHFSPVSTPHGPICLLDGSLLYIGRYFTPMDQYTDMSVPILSAWKLNENDEFVKLGEIQNIRDEYGWLLSAEPHAVQLPDGKIIVHIRVQRDGEHRVFTLYQCESVDGGKTFTTPHQILPDIGGSPAHLLVHSSGRIITTYGYRDAPFGVQVRFSDDGAQTWSEPYLLEGDCQGGDLGYPATVELKDGSLLTVYYESYYSDQPEQSSIMQRVWNLPEKE